MNETALPDTTTTMRVGANATPSGRSGGTARPRRKLTRGFWLRHLHTWHWISSAISLVGLMLFVLTGFTLNHAADISSQPQVVEGSANLPAEMRESLSGLATEGKAPLPGDLRTALSSQTGMAISDRPAELSEDEIYLAMPRPGGDAWVAIDRASGEVTWEMTDRGWISYLNDLHKGRDTGKAWRLFIDVFVLSAMVFIGTGFVLLWLHGRNRPATWPLTGLGFLVPFLLALFFIH
ncbi:hypothetical protein NSU_2730 [Novosphingobium pentaromativorans US6-1]|uniref:PepSY-associated TM helix domain-containing protein n=2 Tax=Novosphingobium pentaromativorans TaxID=205844 RepID=G6EEF9_9SPHN|nr:hypothetical protein NSU_2730 [Novosphingobium pentaromativorans US6-1]